MFNEDKEIFLVCRNIPKYFKININCQWISFSTTIILFGWFRSSVRKKAKHGPLLMYPVIHYYIAL